MLRLFIIPVCALFLSSSLTAADQTRPQQQTIVMIRNAEHPKDGLGQLNCQGLNRALKLPQYFRTHFANPDKIFAPDPAIKAPEKQGDGHYYNYVRPLLTIAPTAINLSMPINTEAGYNQPERLVNTLLREKYRSSVIYIAWEHAFLPDIARRLLKRFNTNTKVPKWNDADYDSVFVFTIDWSQKPATAEFRTTRQNITGLSSKCPSP